MRGRVNLPMMALGLEAGQGISGRVLEDTWVLPLLALLYILNYHQWNMIIHITRNKISQSSSRDELPANKNNNIVYAMTPSHLLLPSKSSNSSPTRDATFPPRNFTRLTCSIHPSNNRVRVHGYDYKLMWLMLTLSYLRSSLLIRTIL